VSDQDAWKRAAAEDALKEVQDGMTIGLGTGSTAKHFVDLLGERVAQGWTVKGVPTSEATAKQARGAGIPLPELHEIDVINVTIDGADEFDGELRLIKGGGGALLREKIIAGASQRMVVIADDSKEVETLGKFPLPIEVVPFGLSLTVAALSNACRFVTGREIDLVLRQGDGKAFMTDGGHYIIDAHCDAIEQPEALAMALAGIPGVVDHGLFLGMASLVVIGGPKGVRRIGGMPSRP
jgi:ribose 5-phosphate isomerase A